MGSGFGCGLEQAGQSSDRVVVKAELGYPPSRKNTVLARKNRLSDSNSIRTAWKTGTKFKTRYFIASVSRSQKVSGERFCFVVSKRVGSAVKRNLVKRRLRTLAATSLGGIFHNHEVVVRAFPEIRDASFSDLQHSWELLQSKLEES